MKLKRITSTTSRVLRQLKHDHRTLGLIFFMPSVLITILYFVFEGEERLFNNVAPLLLGIIPFTLMFIVTSVAVLRERTSGTLERLLTLPITKLEIILGYALAFAILALFQASIASFVAIGLLDVTIIGSPATLLLVAVLAGVCGMSFGLLFSAFSKNEFQAVQFMPAFVLPQFLTCGLFIPREQMALFLQYFSNLMPITYIAEGLRYVQLTNIWPAELTASISAILIFIIFALSFGAVSLKNK